MIVRTINAAREKISNNTGIDPLQRGYDPKGTYEPAPADISGETRRELYRLTAEHDGKVTKLEEELRCAPSEAVAEC